MPDSADAAPDTQALLLRARAGDLAAFDKLMIRHQRLVLNVAWRLLGSREDAKDIGQEVFLRFYRSLKGMREDRQVAPWLYRVTVNACHDLRRRERRWVSLEDQYPSSASGPEEDLGESEQRRVLFEGLERLPEKERAAVLLRDIEGLSTAEVAAILDSSEATVRSQISVARGKLRTFARRVWGRRT